MANNINKLYLPINLSYMKRFLISLYIFSFISSVAYSQNITSLLGELNTAKQDTNKVLLFIKIGNEYENTNLDSAATFYKRAEDLSKKLNFSVGILKYISNYTIILNMQNKFQESLALNLEAVTLAEKIKNKKQLVVAYCNTGASYYGLHLYDNCIDYFLKATLLSEERHDTARMSFLYANLTGLYSEMEAKSIRGYSYGLKSIKISRAIKDTLTLTNALQNTSGILMDTHRYDTALVLLQQAYTLAKLSQNKRGQLPALVNMANIYYKEKKFDFLKQKADEILSLATELEQKEGMANAYYFLGKYYFEQKNYQLAKINTIQALDLAKNNEQKKVLASCYLFLSDIELGLGNLNEYHRYAILSDSVNGIILSDKIEKNVQDFEAKYTLAKKQNEIDNLTREKEIEKLKLQQRTILNWSLVAAVLIILIVGFLYYRNAQQKRKLLEADAALKQQKIGELETEKQLLATQSILQGQEEERKRLAKDLHDGLGSILSGAKFSFNNMKNNLTISPENAAAFERSIAMLDQSIQELRRVAHNMMPEALVKFGLNTALQDFCNSINQSDALQITYQSFDVKDDTVSTNKSSAIYRIVQELVNNILKHAHAKTALVQLVKKDNTLSITVEDDGMGFDKSILQTNSGMGYLNLQNRVAYINGKMDIQTSQNKGTSVNIEISNIAND